MTVEEVLARLHGVRRTGAGWTARCPAHKDMHPSLSIGLGDDGKILINCHAGCEPDAIVAHIGLTLRDLASPTNADGGASSRRIEATYPYRDENGKLLFEVVRFAPKGFAQRRPDGKGGWAWNLDGVRRVLYRLPDLRGKPALFLVEGEKDVERLWSLRLRATTNAGGAGKWREEYTNQLWAAKVKRVAILPDNDEPGERRARDVARSCLKGGLQVKVLRLEGLQVHGDVSDWLDAGHSAEELKKLASEGPWLRLEDLEVEQPVIEVEGGPVEGADSVDSVDSVRGETHPWEPPLPFHAFDPPPFPIDAMPDWLRQHAEAVAISTQTPTDLAGVLEICTCGGAVAKKAIVRVRDDFDEPLNVYGVVVLPPAERKSRVFSIMVDPIERHEEELAQAAGSKIAEAENAFRIKELDLQQARKAATTADPSKRPPLEERAKRLACEIAEMSIPKPPRLLVDDITPEKLAIMIAEQGGRMALMSAEGGIFDIISGRYSTNNAPNLDVFLKSHPGDTLRVDRVGRPSEFVKKPALTIGLTVQPDVIAGLLLKPTLRGRGLLARFMYSLPKSMLGHREINPPTVPPSVARAYRENLTKLLRLPFGTDPEGKPGPHILTLAPAAADGFWDFAGEVEPKLAEFGELSDMTDWAGKLVGLVVRLAGIFHLASLVDGPAPWEVPIPLKTMQGAIRVGRYLTVHARAALAKMGVDPMVEHSKLILTWGKKREFQKFSRRDLWQDLRSRFDKVDDLDAPLALLIEHRYIHKDAPPARPGSGQKPSPTFSFNPTLAAQNPQNTQNRPQSPNSVDSVYSVGRGQADTDVSQDGSKSHPNQGTTSPGDGGTSQKVDGGQETTQPPELSPDQGEVVG